MEGLKYNPYSDATGGEINQWVEGATIWYGHYIDKWEWDKYKNGINKEQSLELFKKDFKKKNFEGIVKDSFKDIPLTQNEYDALVMRAYNCGKGGFTTHNTHAKEMTEYIKSGKNTNDKEFAILYQGQRFSGSTYMRGVENRRIKELDIFQRNDYNEYPREYYNERRIYDKKK